MLRPYKTCNPTSVPLLFTIQVTLLSGINSQTLQKMSPLRLETKTIQVKGFQLLFIHLIHALKILNVVLLPIQQERLLLSQLMSPRNQLSSTRSAYHSLLNPKISHTYRQFMRYFLFSHYHILHFHLIFLCEVLDHFGQLK